MDVVRFGRQLRALRRRLALRQADLAARARMSQSSIARVERGRADRLTVHALEAIAAAVGARLVVRLEWNGEGLDRLLDADHAQLVDAVLSELRDAGWAVVPETTFAIGAERGSIDIIAWHGPTRTVLVVEAKTVVPDLQSMLVALDRKVRLAPRIAADLGWMAGRIAWVLVFAESSTTRRRVASHMATFKARFPDRTLAVHRFLREPAASSRPLHGLWFLPLSHHPTPRQRVRVRTPVPHA